MLLLILVVGYGAINSGTNLVYYLFSFLASAFLAHGIVSPRNLDHLQVRRRLPRRVVAGSCEQIFIEIENRRRWWGAHSLLAEDYASRQGSPQVVGSCPVLHVPARGNKVSAYPTLHPLFKRRGVVTFHEVVVRSRFPFGFIERSLHVPAPADVLVLPPIFQISEPLFTLLGLDGDLAAVRRGGSGDLYGLREYVQGEPAKRIHWRTTARAQKLMVTEFEHEERQRVILYLPTTARHVSDELLNDFEHAVIVAASFSAYLIKTGYDVGLLTDSSFVEPAGGEQHVERLLRALALVEIGTESSRLPTMPHIRDCRVFVLTYSNDEGHLPSDLVAAKVDARDWQIRGTDLIRSVSS